MGTKEILNRLKKMENSVQKSENITVICLVNGVKKRKIMSMHEAQEQIMYQSSCVFFGKECDMNNCIVGVEYEGSDGFLECMLDTEPMDPELKERIEKGYTEEEERWNERFKIKPQLEPVKEVAPAKTFGNEMHQLIKKRKEEMMKKDKERENKADIAKRAFAKRERISNG